VVAFIVHHDSQGVDRHTKEINSLAAEGWEYVGLLCAGPDPFLGGVAMREPQSGGGNVLFKRPKR